jgi:uncharacterized protein
VSIQGFDKDVFGKKLAQTVSASRPVQSVQHLKGRAKDLNEIEKALYAPGRHVFIFGDRGVGKSSLAATAAMQYQSSDNAPIFVSGSRDATFTSIVSNVVYQALKRPRTENRKTNRVSEISFKGLRAAASTETSWPDIASLIRSVGDAVELLREVGETYADQPVAIIDEFDTIGEASERDKFAELLKQLGDQSDRMKLKLIFTGIGQSISQLLGAHPSAHRQLLTWELPRLNYEGRREIVEAAAAEFGLTVDNNVNWRIAQVSDGYPYYVHSITEHMLWAAFEDPNEVTELEWEHFDVGLRAAVQSINAELRKPYELAVLHREVEFEDIVWATADHEDLIRTLQQMYESYQIIAAKREGHLAVDRDRFGTQVRKLKGAGFGAILQQVDGRAGLYSYREKMLRGYVRMQAAANGVELTGEHLAPKQVMHVSNARSGYRGPSLPPGVRDELGIRRSDPKKDR